MLVIHTSYYNFAELPCQLNGQIWKRNPHSTRYFLYRMLHYEVFVRQKHPNYSSQHACPQVVLWDSPFITQPGYIPRQKIHFMCSLVTQMMVNNETVKWGTRVLLSVIGMLWKPFRPSWCHFFRNCSYLSMSWLNERSQGEWRQSWR